MGAAPEAALLRDPPTDFRRIAVVITDRNISRQRGAQLLGGELVLPSQS